MPKLSDKLSSGAVVAIQMGSLSSRQVANKRTRVEHPGGRAENVAEHSLMLAKVAPELSRVLYPNLDENLVARYSTLHDDIEAYVGDTPTDILANLDEAAKEKLEAKGLKQLINEHSHMPGYVELVVSYEAQSVPEARFVRAVDKLMVILIHFPNHAKVLRRHYTYSSFLSAEEKLIKRDMFKYSEFDKIVDLRKELGKEIADKHLS